MHQVTEKQNRWDVCLKRIKNKLKLTISKFTRLQYIAIIDLFNNLKTFVYTSVHLRKADCKDVHFILCLKALGGVLCLMYSKVWVTKEYEYKYKKGGKLLQKDLYKMMTLHNYHFGDVCSVVQKKVPWKCLLNFTQLIWLRYSIWQRHFK